MMTDKTGRQAPPTAVPEHLADEHSLPIDQFRFTLLYLNFYGYLKEPPTAETLAEAVRKFQAAAGIDVDGVLGQQTLETMWLPRCGVRDDAFTEAARWRKEELAWWPERYLEGIPGLSRLDQDDLQTESLKDFEAYVKVRWRKAASRSQADLIVSTGEGRADGFDGPGGVLAWCQIPPGDDRPITMKFDRSDRWIRSADAGTRGILYGHVDRHEKGHAHGMLHVSGEVALLNAIYNPNVGTLRPADIKALYALGYAKAEPPPTPPTPGKPGIVLEFDGPVPPFTVKRV